MKCVSDKQSINLNNVHHLHTQSLMTMDLYICKVYL